jgi:hypothetical protein
MRASLAMIVLPTLSGAGLTAALLPCFVLRGGMIAQRDRPTASTVEALSDRHGMEADRDLVF